MSSSFSLFFIDFENGRRERKALLGIKRSRWVPRAFWVPQKNINEGSISSRDPEDPAPRDYTSWPSEGISVIGGRGELPSGARIRRIRAPP